jgi:hypothetical protein
MLKILLAETDKKSFEDGKIKEKCDQLKLNQLFIKVVKVIDLYKNC